MSKDAQITVAPTCPACGEQDSAVCRSKGMVVQYEGRSCRAARQYRKCRHCGENFPVVHIKGNLARKARRRSNV